MAKMNIEINNKEQLLEGLKDILAVEIIARDNYIKDLKTFTNKKIDDTILHIKKEEDRHINMLRRAIELLEE